MILKLDNVTMKFGAFTALSHLNFDIEEKEIFGIAGPNGAGKTTIFNVITGTLPGTGKILFDDQNIINLKPYQICNRGIARTFQTPQLFSTLSVYQNIKVGAHFGGQIKENQDSVIKEMMDFVCLKAKETELAENLTLLEKKQVMVATALATKPKILLLDEPISGLGESDVDFFLELIQKINRELGITIIVIEHLMKFIIQLCDRLMILDNGEKVIIGPPLEVTKTKEVIDIYLGSGGEDNA
ncbi:MAG: ABC transporter ATP-binding protein [Deltaproteobacteria bacterium]|jgi:branched-chain amino acid transport system ATP-binding protein|nr:ABC transporter ATP-binding protein [Deltaproteobacteria bacterium]MBT4527654.1 ABC transporter ATP-binding protein [Deltaproteobacteria bacterium]